MLGVAGSGGGDDAVRLAGCEESVSLAWRTGEGFHDEALYSSRHMATLDTQLALLMRCLAGRGPFASSGGVTLKMSHELIVDIEVHQIRMQ